ncbi:hypothetical protein KSS87_022132 [Heliosperma pusillum]|nr:hypothetical protein KSS87_022132 [Heliosperma pusillum]
MMEFGWGYLKVEGAYLEDGKGLSNWDVFSHLSGNTVDNENGDVADDHYHRYEVGGRFGEINPSGVAFYNKIIDNLLLKAIFKWAVVVNLVYQLTSMHKQHGYIGIAICASSYVPYRDDKFSRHAVARAYATNVAWIIDPLIYGKYPSLMRKYHGKELPKFTKEEVKLLKGSVDFVGLNHYTTFYTIDCFHYSSECSSKDNRAIKGFLKTTGFRDGIPIGEQAGSPRFFVVPKGMELIVDYFRKRYPDLALYITENGYAPPTLPDVPDILHDVERVEFLRTYIAALGKAMRKGAKVKGYFAWSFMDNFEWADGYTPTYGLYYVDRATQQRIPKLSAYWFAGFLANHSPHQYLLENQQKLESQ